MLAQKGTKNAPRVWLRRTPRHRRAFIVTTPLDPRLRGTPSCFPGNFIRRASSSQSPLYSGCPSVGIRHAAPLLLLSPPNPLRWALAGTPIKCLRCTSTACSGITVAVGQLRMHLPDYRRTKQVGTQEAVYVRITYSQILMEEGPCGPGVKRRTVKIWAAGKYETTEVAHSRK